MIIHTFHQRSSLQFTSHRALSHYKTRMIVQQRQTERMRSLHEIVAFITLKFEYVRPQQTADDSDQSPKDGGGG